MAKKSSSKKFGLDFAGVAEFSEQLEKLGGDLQQVTTDALQFIPEYINPKLRAAMAKHTRYSRGKTKQTIVEDQKVSWTGYTASIPVGFDLKNGGLASIFLMYGTPRHAPKNQWGGPTRPGAREHPGMQADEELKGAIYGKQTQAEIAKRQQAIFEAAIEKLLK